MKKRIICWKVQRQEAATKYTAVIVSTIQIGSPKRQKDSKEMNKWKFCR